MSFQRLLLRSTFGGVFTALLVLGGCTREGSAPERYDFDLKSLASQSAVAESREAEAGTELLLQGSPTEGLRLPGVGAGVPWGDMGYVVLQVEHEDPHSDIVWIEFFRRGEVDSPRISAKIGVLPQLSTQIVFPLDYLDGQRFFMERFPRQLKGVVPGRRLDSSEIDWVRVRVGPAEEGLLGKLWVRNIALTRELPPPMTGGPVVVDEVGQWKVRDWPGKVTDPEQVPEVLRDVAQGVHEASFPGDWSRFGGWKKKPFQATGFFRTQHDGQRWWLVDPEGYAFFSVGVDVMTPYSSGPVEGMEDLFAKLPSEEGENASAWLVSTNRKELSYLTFNWIRTFGSEWRERWEETTRNLLISWQFNTVGNWSDLDFARNSQLPYVVPLNDFPTTSVRLYRDFPDVFSAEYEAAAEEFARQLEAFRGDAYLIGYFLANEPVWAFGDNVIAGEMLATAQPSASRERLVQWLRERYDDQVEKLSEAWGVSLTAFEQLMREPFPRLLDEGSSQAEADLREFSGILVDRYLEVPSRALREVDPDHLNLGIRYAGISSDLCYRAGTFFDVFSINSYTWRPDPAVVSEITRRTGKPVLIGEFHHGAIDRGLPSTGIKGVASQEERGVAYRYYVEQGAALPEVVALHYFQLNDQPILGRFDGENYNIGLVDVVNRPYPELTAAAKETNGRIYEVAAGVVTPVDRTPRRIADIYF